MRERVYKEWMSLHGDGLNGLLNIRVALISTLIIATGLELIWKHKKIPYDDEILDEVTGINGERARKQMLENTCRRAHRGWF